MKFNLDGQLIDSTEEQFYAINRAFTHGDSVVEVLRVHENSILFWENHYFNLMASMRILRMNIPLAFTPEFFREEINKVISENGLSTAKITFTVWRNHNPNLLKANVSFLIEANYSENKWQWNKSPNEIEVYKDHHVNHSFYSQINAHKPEEIIAEIFRLENEYGDLILLNSFKRMAKTLKGSIFIINNTSIRTPLLSEGGTRSVIREELIKKIKKSAEFSIEETEIFPYEIQKSEEVFVLIDGYGIESVTRNRKKEYAAKQTEKIFELLDELG